MKRQLHDKPATRLPGSLISRLTGKLAVVTKEDQRKRSEHNGAYLERK
jgi:hypothetical protein